MNKLFLLFAFIAITNCKSSSPNNNDNNKTPKVVVNAKDSIRTPLKEQQKIAVTKKITDTTEAIKPVAPLKIKTVEKNSSKEKATTTKDIKIAKETQKTLKLTDSITTEIKEITKKPIIKEQARTITKKEIVAKKETHKTQPIINHSAWNKLLIQYVSKEGNVDYASFKKNTNELNTYLNYLAKNSPMPNWTKNEKLAYYINLYNAATVKLILDNYPTKSIKDLKNPWGKKIVKIGSELISLGDVEHKILRKMNEPRIHFAINCASYSCPKLLNRVFLAATMEKQLEQVTKDFVNDISRNNISENSIELSEIFKWYKKDFTTNGSLINYINKYTNTPIATEAKISYNKYDWSLNERK